MAQPDLSHIHESLRHLVVPISSLIFDPHNARLHDEKNQLNVLNSLKQFGQRLPIVVQKQGMIIRVGNNRTAQAKKLGWTHIAAVIVDEADVDAIAFALADNRSAEDGASWDLNVLAESMETIQNLLGASSLELDMDALGWSKDERELLLGAFDVSVAPIPALPTPDEKKPFQQITFMLSDPQAATMKHVVDRALKLGYGKDESGTNTNKNANAIAKVCEQWLALIESGTE